MYIPPFTVEATTQWYIEIGIVVSSDPHDLLLLKDSYIRNEHASIALGDQIASANAKLSYQSSLIEENTRQLNKTETSLRELAAKNKTLLTTIEEKEALLIAREDDITLKKAQISSHKDEIEKQTQYITQQDIQNQQLSGAISSLTQEIYDLGIRNVQIRTQIETLQRSLSWRLTKPFRACASFVNSLFKTR